MVVDRLDKQLYKQSDLIDIVTLEQELAQRFCPSCPISRWRYTAACRGNTLFCGYKWEGKEKKSYCIWMYPPGTPRLTKHIVAEAPSLTDLCGCKFNK